MRRVLSACLGVFVAVAGLIGSVGPAGAAPSPRANAAHVCPTVAAPGAARCLALVRTDRDVHLGPKYWTNGSGYIYGPADLHAAYQTPWNLGAGQTVAIVDAYDDPTAASDLNNYRSTFGLPACTTSNGCFVKVNQAGHATSFPGPNIGWAQEISLDLDMVSAICPNCKILLVEANSANFSDLGTAVNTAARMGAKAISNSYGGPEFSGETYYESYYNHPGVAVTVSSGDSGYGVEFPASSRYVTAVGGTSLKPASGTSRGWAETAWSGAGSGCSAFIPKPSWQNGGACANRSVADVSAVADPNTGVWVYDTFGSSGWYIFGGTSVASPIIASMYALAGNAGAISNGSYSYAHLSSLNDVTSGSNGGCGTYLCTAGPGYDGPTGNGTPKGAGAF